MSKGRLNDFNYVNPLIANFEDFKFIAGFFNSEVRVSVFGALRSMLKNAKVILNATGGSVDTYQKLLSELYEIQDNLESDLLQAAKHWFNEFNLITSNPSGINEENYFEVLFDKETRDSIVCDITTSWLNISFGSARPVAVFAQCGFGLNEVGAFENKVYHFVNDVMESHVS